MTGKESGLCGQHPDRVANSVCLRCGLFLCQDCLFDIISVHCEPCTEIYLYSVKMPPRPMTKRSYLVTAVLSSLVFIALFFGLWLQGQSLWTALFHSCLHSFFIGLLSIQFSQSYSAGKLNDRGREDFVEDYLMLMMRSKLFLKHGGFDYCDLDTAFEINFGSLDLEDKLTTLRGFCDFVEKDLAERKDKQANDE